MKRFLKSSFFWFTLLAIVLLSVSVWLTWWRWDWLHTSASTTASNSETLRNVGLLIGGLLAFLFAMWRGWLAERQSFTTQRQADIAEQSLLDERYQRGAEMLGSEVLPVRLGGIYALQTLATEHPVAYHIQIMQLFCAFVRNPLGDKEDFVVEYEGNVSFNKLRDDLQAAMTAIINRKEVQINLEHQYNYKPDLSGAYLKYLAFEDANLSNVNLSWADLTDAYLYRADLSNAGLTHTNLSGATLAFANLSKAILRYADLSDTKAPEAILSNATIDYADLSNADLNGARLDGATLYGTILSGADFSFNAQGPAEGLTQWQLNCASADKDNPPKLARVIDAKTGRSLEWRGTAIDC